MNVSEAILKEADILLKAFATGVILIFVYDLLRIIRRLLPHKAAWISIEDILFWAGSAIAIFAMLYRENDGYLRGFSIGGVVLGMLIYSLTLSRFVVEVSVLVLEKILYLLAASAGVCTSDSQTSGESLWETGKKSSTFFEKTIEKNMQND